MRRQKLTNPQLSALKGVGVVLGLILAVLVLSMITDMLIPLVGESASAGLFWGLGVLLALWTMRRFVLAYTYSLDAHKLTITFAYGRYERPMVELYFNNILATGAPEELRARYPDARVRRALRKANPTPILAVACRDGGAPAIFLLQPEAEIRAKLEEAARGKRKK